MKKIKVLYDGEEVTLQDGATNEHNDIMVVEIKNLSGKIIAYHIYLFGYYDCREMIAKIDTINPQNSWKSNRIEIVLEQSFNATANTNKQGVILNYTPHTVNIIDSEGNKIQDFPSAGEVRCKQSTVTAGTIGDIPITSTNFGDVEGLPEEEEGVYYIVSRLTRQALPNREDLLVPNEMVRGKEGKIIGCKSLANN